MSNATRGNTVEDATTPLNMSLEYKSPEQTYADALNFDATTNAATTTSAAGATTTTTPERRSKRSINERLRSFVQRLNDSAYVYPTVAVFIMTLIVIVAIFQQSISVIIKALLILVLMAFLFYTIWQFRSKT